VVSYSSSYNSGWEAATVLGAPRVFPKYGDIRGAWAPASSSGTYEYLELAFPSPVFITGIDIFETHCPGHFDVIYAKLDETEVTLWKTVIDPQKNAEYHRERKSRIFTPDIEKPVIRSNTIRLNLNCTMAPTWAEIDCVILRGVHYIEWTTELNRKFSKSFQAMVKTLLLINERHLSARGYYWLPKPIVFIIINYCAQDWTEPKPKLPSTEPEITTSVENTPNPEEPTGQESTRCLLM